ncbi:hypothetical protein Mukteswar_003370 [Burkholderia mallei]|nr:hypothetical protein [Burkholderia mallei]WPJ35388.1 hypothetical protein Zagreb_003830 [Burkholderia mallei]WPJ35797.1 hypothetical protein Mukteswar_003370 [Burkholderia mallei]WPJ40598.1 hypothetical protein Bogor_000123 [Burkholderia mallei]WPJ46829.1 hypothetical protein atcc23344_001593 [Burkholderia mallei]
MVVIAVSRSFVPALVECDDDAPFISVARFAVFAPVMSFGPFALPFAPPVAAPAPPVPSPAAAAACGSARHAAASAISTAVARRPKRFAA